MRRVEKSYIVLGQWISPQEQKTLENWIQSTLTLTLPSETFVASLERNLIAEAHRRQRQIHLWQAIGLLVLMGGGLLSIGGGIWVWEYWRRGRDSRYLGGRFCASTTV